jgi:hypothetical protein
MKIMSTYHLPETVNTYRTRDKKERDQMKKERGDDYSKLTK